MILSALKHHSVTILCRHYALYTGQIAAPRQNIPAKQIRQRFLDFFIEGNGYHFVRSSPVVPFCDPTVPFVNAGMNQFKGIFLGNRPPQYPRVANSQKCIRVGGKHNDLNVVGSDGYHHTFFEMLGNWTFNECSKEHACQMAWKLLTEVYNIQKERLFVTYFGGDEALELGPDLECREVWRSIGVPDDRILPFGVKDNFWEMGAVGPCGPCTEIHFDHGSMNSNRAVFVNKGLFELVEIWNLVFIEYNRSEDGSITLLPQKHLDTGMGLERLVGCIQGRVSNYDTDIFRPLFNAIQKICVEIPRYRGVFGENDWNHMNAGYRILADHSRMVTACLADGMIPEQNHKLRKIMRRAFAVSEHTFRQERGLLKELSNYVIESLGSVYPEMEKNVKQIHQIIEYEEDVYHVLRKTASNEWSKITSDSPELSSLDFIEMPGLVQAFKELETSKIEEITPQLAFKLYDTYGIDADTITKLASSLDLQFDEGQFSDELEKVKLSSRKKHIVSGLVDYSKISSAKTDDSFKYDYKKFGEAYVFKELPVKVLQIIRGADLVEMVEPNVECTLLLDKTNLYAEAGGQSSDKGYISFTTGTFDIHDIKNVNDFILHKGVLLSDNRDILTKGEQGILHFDEDIRISNMRNHTATHLLNAVLKKLKGATCQKSSKVNDRYLNFDISVFGDKLSISDIAQAEAQIKDLVKASIPVKTTIIDSQTLLDMQDVTVVPGEAYPEYGIRLIEIVSPNGTVSKEPCCGTHVMNTADLEEFVIVNFKSLGRSTTSIWAVTGDRAKIAIKNGEEIKDFVAQLKSNVRESANNKIDVLEIAIASLRQQLDYDIESESIMPVTVKYQCIEDLNEVGKQIKENARNSLRDFIDMEMKTVLETKRLKSNTNRDFIVHYLRTSMILESVPLQRATKICKDVPVLVISYCDNIVKARCCVPESYVTEDFNAEKWLKVIGDIFNSQVTPPKGQDPCYTCNLKGKRVSMSEWHVLLNDSLEAAKSYATEHL